jgi:cytochrome c nitrite reductase small subunit
MERGRHPRPTGARAAYTLAALVGVPLGLGAFTFQYAEGLSYFSTDPRACVNCHIMREAYDSWQKSSHHANAVCVDCHLPHDVAGKYLAKARNGWNHSRAFTLQDFPEPIRITPPNARILQANCMHCHEAVISAIVPGHGAPGGDLSCVRCHASVGHGPVR